MALYADIFDEVECGQITGSSYDQILSMEIHQAIALDKMLSVVSKNIQIIVDHGVVTLTGEVFCDEEKKIIGNQAIAHAGCNNVSNELEVIEERE